MDFFSLIKQQKNLQEQIDKEEILIKELLDERQRKRSRSEHKRLNDLIKIHTDLKHILGLNLNKIIEKTPKTRTEKKSFFNSTRQKKRKSLPKNIFKDIYNLFSKPFKIISKK